MTEFPQTSGLLSGKPRGRIHKQRFLLLNIQWPDNSTQYEMLIQGWTQRLYSQTVFSQLLTKHWQDGSMPITYPGVSPEPEFTSVLSPANPKNNQITVLQYKWTQSPNSQTIYFLLIKQRQDSSTPIPQPSSVLDSDLVLSYNVILLLAKSLPQSWVSTIHCKKRLAIFPSPALFTVKLTHR